MRAAPKPVVQSVPVVIRDGEREQEFGCDHAERNPDRAVPRQQRDEDRADRERQPRVDRDRDDVDDHKGTDQQTDEPVHVFDGELRPASKRLASGHRQAKQDAEAQQEIRSDSRRAGRVPVDRIGGQVHAGSGSRLRRHASFSRTVPSARTKRPGIPRVSSQAGPSSSSRNAAFAAVSAATQVAPQAVT